MKHLRAIIYSILLLIIFGAIVYLHNYHRDWEQKVAIFATASSIVSVFIAIFEVLKLRNTTEAVSQSLKETKREINEFLSFSEINEMTRLIDEIEAYVNDNHYESAWLKLKEFKGILDKQTVYILNTYKGTDYPKKIGTNKIRISMDIKNLFQKVNDKDIPIEKEIIIANLDNTKECLHEMSGQLKAKRI